MRTYFPPWLQTTADLLERAADYAAHAPPSAPGSVLASLQAASAASHVPHTPSYARARTQLCEMTAAAVGQHYGSSPMKGMEGQRGGQGGTETESPADTPRHTAHAGDYVVGGVGARLERAKGGMGPRACQWGKDCVCSLSRFGISFH